MVMFREIIELFRSGVNKITAKLLRDHIALSGTINR